MILTLFQVDAFADRLFSGNPAAVCPLDEWLSDDIMQAIAMENNLSETAFFVKNGPDFDLRWFTPKMEVALCGHATLASAHVLFEHLGYGHPSITFHTRSGPLSVKKSGDAYQMNFPADQLKEVETPSLISEALDVTPLKTFKGRDDYLSILETEEQIAGLNPNFGLIGKLKTRGLIVTAPDREVDFVSRCFFPYAGIDEDPATGSAHTTLAPYWAKRLEKTALKARQLSQRGAEIQCKLLGERVEISGRAVTYMRAEVFGLP